MINLKLLTSIFEKGEHTARPRAASAPPLGPIPPYLLDRDKIANIGVLISSPLTQLAEERRALLSHLRYATGVDPVAFEHRAREGQSPEATSRRYVDQCDIFVMLIGEDKGSICRDTGKTYSQIEFETMVERQRTNSGRPRVLIYVAASLTRALDTWELEATEDYGAYRWKNQDELLFRATVDILGSVIAERREQAAELARQRAACQGQLALEQAATQQAHAVTQTRESTIGALSKSLAAAEAAVERWIERADPAKLKPWRLAAWTLGCSLAGLVVGVLLPRAHADSQSTLTLASPDLKLASAAVDRIASHLESLPGHVRSKALVAEQLNAEFDCADRSRADYPVDGIESAWFSRRDICEGVGAIVVRMEHEAAACATEVIPVEQTRALAEQLARSKVRLAAVRIIGHASSEPLKAPCPMSPVLTQCLSQKYAGDFVIDSNDKLAAARAAAFTCQLEAALSATGAPIPRFERAGFGTLDAARSDGSSARHRKVDVELYAAALP